MARHSAAGSLPLALLRATAALLLLAALLLGAPWALLQVGQLPQTVPTLDNIGEFLSGPADATVLAPVITLAGWAGWAVFVAAVVLETGAALAHRAAPKIRGLSGMQSAASFLIGSIVLLAPTAAAAATAAPPAAAAVHVPGTPTSDQSTPAAGSTDAPTHRVKADEDTWVDLAEKYLGDGERWKDIADANPDLPTHDAIPVGTEIRLPADAKVPQPASGGNADFRGPVYEVTKTQKVADIAVAELGDRDKAKAISDLNPDLIHPDGTVTAGTVLKLPDRQPADAAEPKTDTPDRSTPDPDSKPAADGADDAPAAGSYQVKPGDNLSVIAEEAYGKQDWRRLYDANKDHAQPNGLPKITDPDLIYPGQHLTLPGAKAGTDTDRPDRSRPGPESDGDEPSGRDSAPANPPEHAEPPAPSDTEAPTPSGEQDAGKPEQQPAPGSSQTPRPESSAPATPQPEGARSAVTDSAGDDDSNTAAVALAALGAAGILAASVLGTVRLRRRLQLRSRPPEARIPLSEGRPAATERGLRTVEERGPIAFLTAALRTMAMHAAAAGRPLPRLEALVLGPQRLVLHLADPQPPLPPFTAAGGDTTQWTCPTSTTALATPDAYGETDLPYPTLVTLGHTLDNNLVMLDLEHLGVLHLTGDEDRCRTLLHALTVELANSRFADHPRLTAIDDTAPGLEQALPKRVTRAGLVDAAAELGAHVDAQHRLMASLGVDSLPALRTADTDEISDPHIVVVRDLDAHPEAECVALFDTLTAGPRTASAILAHTAGPGAPLPPDAVTLNLAAGDGTVLLPSLGLPVKPQTLPDETYEHSLTILATANRPADRPAPEWTRRPPTLTKPAASATGTAEPLATPVAEPLATGVAEHESALAGEPDDGVNASGPLSSAAPGNATAIPAIPAPSRGEQPQPPAPEGEPQAGEALTLADILGEPDDRPAAAEQAPGDDEAPPPVEPVTEAVDEPAQAETPLPPSKWFSDPEPSTPQNPMVNVLGPVDLVGARGKPESHRNTSLKIAAFLALHPLSTMEALDAAIWPNSNPGKGTRGPAVGRLRRWLGKAPDGHAYFPLVADSNDRYTLAEDVACDWHQFQEFYRAGVNATGDDADLALRRALALVRGVPFADFEWPWAADLAMEMTQAIHDAAHLLAERCLNAKDYRGGIWAVDQGLKVDDISEVLHRDKFRLYAAAGDFAGLRRAAERLERILLEVRSEKEDATERLLAELMPRKKPLTRT
ncbi:LysM peptidoglycan-binding domain-containing protein [Streptomyces sp. A7024]|uniref:LysM peptidoglycan-binding domain-containing protein n=1 Tax=Streptomyces coryli TaxID=1128680 RepID=A0A6G4TTW0_9ACTN|nr:LysM peptidoglycan-binding domain-containing protein [Streptomyces coryli]NGN63212.1 LysM peptidoglycan-binding domain-containing protein [Streptomyces coryli]